MTSEIRTNSLTSRAGLSTVTMTDSGPMFSGITTFVDNSGFTFGVGAGSSIFTPAANTLTLGTNSLERLRIDSSGRVLIGSTALAGDATLQVYTADQKHPAIKVNASNANGFSMLADAYQADESQVNIGVSYSSAKLVLSTSVKPSDTADNTYLSSQDTFAARPCALTMNHQGVLAFFNTSTSATTTTDSAVSLTERLRITKDGEMLLGTAGADRGIAGQRFNSGNGWSGTLQIEKTPAGNNNVPFLAITAWNGANEQYTGGISFNRSNSNTQGTQGAVNTNQQLGNIAFNGSDGTNFIQGAEIFAIPDQTFATNDGPASLVFATTPDGTGEDEPQERLRITSDGLLLLGTTDTGFSGTYTNMTIGNASLGNSGITIASSATGIGRLHFADGNSGAAQYAGWIAYNHNSNSMLFSTNQAGSEKVTIGPYGEVKMASTSNSHRGLSVTSPATQINFGVTHNKGGFLLSTTDGQFSLSGGGYWGGSNWVATATASTQIRHDGGTDPMKFCFNTGLTAGNNFTPTTRLEISPSGNMKLSDPGITFSDSSPFFPVAWSNVDGVNTTFTIASTTYANLRFRGEYSTGTEYTMGVGGGIFYMAYDDIQNQHRITVAANGVVSLNVNDTSDEKMKKNITSLADGAIDRIKQLRPVNFDWKKDSDLNGQSGFIAQEIKTVIPDLVQGEEYVEGNIESVGYSVNTIGIVAHLTKAFQEAVAKIETLEQDNIALRERVTNLEGE